MNVEQDKSDLLGNDWSGTSGAPPQDNDLKKIQGRFSPASILLITVLGIAVAEIIAMVVVFFYRYLPYYQQVLLDAAVMMVIIFPLLYFLSFRPLLQHIARRYQVEQEVRAREQKELALLQTIHTMQLDIARDLHDTIGQNIGYLRMRLDYLAERDLPSTPEDMRAEFVQMSQVATESYDLVRGTLAILQSKGSGDLLHLFKRYASQVVERSELHIEFNHEGETGMLSTHQMRQVFYIFREALSNIEKHSGASEAEVSMRWEPDALALSITDNGKGFDLSQVSDHDSHYGLKFMRERTAMMSGSFQLNSKPGAGTQVVISVPIRRDQRVLAEHLMENGN